MIRLPKLPDLLRRHKGLRLAALAFSALACANLLASFLLYIPGTALLGERRDRYAELRRRRAEAILFDRQRAAYAGISAGIPTQKDMPLVVKELVQDARRLRLEVGAVSYDIPRRGREGLTLLSFTFPGGGAYGDIKRFLYDVETSGRMLAIEKVELSKEQKKVRFDLKLATYLRGSGGGR